MISTPRIHGTTVKARNLVTSVGCPFIDELLGGGLPVSGIYLIDECNTRFYAPVLEKYFIAEGIYYKHKLLIASPRIGVPEIMRTLPSKITTEKENGEQIVVNKVPDEDLKIAWRYSTVPKSGSAISTEKKQTFDLSKPMSSDLIESSETLFYPSTKGLSDVPPCSYEGLWSAIRKEVLSEKYSISPTGGEKNLLRLVLEDFGSPLWTEHYELFRFLACLRAIISETLAVVMIVFNSNCVSVNVRDKVYSYCDAVFSLQTPDQGDAMDVVNERFDGYFRILKLPTLFSVATPSPVSTDLVFELHKKYFEIRVYHLQPTFANVEKPKPKFLCHSVSDEF